MSGCDVCNPAVKGYTVYFSEEEHSLKEYFQGVSRERWHPVNNRMLWVEEPIFFDVIDYLKAHMDEQKIHAVESKALNPLKDLDKMKPIAQFAAEREASWIDEVILNRSICTHYQPIVAVKDGEIEIIGHELLSRGLDGNGDIIPPFKLFEAARIRNRVFSLDRVCRLEGVRNAGAVTDKMIFINFIPTAIYVPEHCLASTFALIKELGMKPEQVVFEVVETDEVDDLEHLKRILEYYKSHGFKYALDDVGVGYNNLSKLAQMEPDIVKLAFEFTNGVNGDIAKQKIAKSVLTIAHDMGAKALAEGVETEEDLQYLLQLGYDLFQGYLFGRPEPEPRKAIELQFV